MTWWWAQPTTTFLRGPEDLPIKLSTTVRILDQRTSAKPERDASK